MKQHTDSDGYEIEKGTTMKYALIGCGRISTNHIKAAVNNGLEIVAVCDLLPERMEALLEKHGLADDDSIRR